MKIRILGVGAVVALCVVCCLADAARACVSYVPPQLTVIDWSELGSAAEGSTRLHSDLLTEESPAVWWKAHRKEVMEKLKANADAGLPTRRGIGGDVIANIQVAPDQYAMKDAGELKEYLGLLRLGLSDTSARNYKIITGSKLSIPQIQTIVNGLTTRARKISLAVDIKGPVDKQRDACQDALTSGWDAEFEDTARDLLSRVGELAFSGLVRERAVMARLWRDVPERVAVDAVLNVVYLNKNTAKTLPAFNFEFYYHRFNRDTARARRECAQILIEMGPHALPFIDRALAELRAPLNGSELTVVVDNETRPDQIGSLGSSGMDADGAPVNKYNEPDTRGIHPQFQLIDMAIDFKWVFDAVYDTQFIRNDDAESALEAIRKTILAQPATMK